MTLYYSSGRMRSTINADSEDLDKMEAFSSYRKLTPPSRYARSVVSTEQAKIDSTDYLRRKVMEPCSFCKGKKRINKENLLMMILRGEV